MPPEVKYCWKRSFAEKETLLEQKMLLGEKCRWKRDVAGKEMSLEGIMSSLSREFQKVCHSRPRLTTTITTSNHALIPRSASPSQTPSKINARTLMVTFVIGLTLE